MESIYGAVGPQDALNQLGFFWLVAASDRAKQDDAELTAHEAVDDDVDRRVHYQHGVSDDDCVVIRSLGVRDVGVHSTARPRRVWPESAADRRRKR